MSEKTWEEMEAHERNVWVHGRVFGRRVLTALEMAEEAADVRKTQPACRSFMLGFYDTGEGFRQSVPDYTSRPEADLTVLLRYREAWGILFRKTFGTALWTLWSQRAIDEADSWNASAGMAVVADLWLKATQYRVGDYSHAAFMAQRESAP